MLVRSLDLESDHDLEAWRSVLTTSLRAVDDTHVPRDPSSFAAMMRAPDPGHRHHLLIATEDGHALALGVASLPEQHNTTTAWIDIHVLPQYRRRGIGSLLLRELEAWTPPGRTHLNGGTTVAAQNWRNSAPVQFAQRHGWTTHSHAVVRRLSLPIDPSAGAAQAMDVRGYRIETHIDGVPEKWFPGYGELMGRLDVEAPSGERQWEPSPVSWHDYLVGMQRCAAAGEIVVESLAIAADDELVGYSDLVVGTPGRPVMQGGTLVASAHRPGGVRTPTPRAGPSPQAGQPLSFVSA